MDDFTYYKNMVVQSILWSTISFTRITLSFMTKYQEGGIFLNYYLDGAAGFVGSLVALPIYRCLKMRLSFIISFSLVFIGIFFVMLFQNNVIYPGWITCFGLEPSPYEYGSEKDLLYYNNYLSPVLFFFTKLNVASLYTYVFQCGYNEDLIFPFYKRLSSTGICNFIGRIVTIAAPSIAELPCPLPGILLLTFQTIAIIASCFLPSREEIEKY
jgi:hypothetical protein